MDPAVENLLAGMPEADRDQLSADMGAWAHEHGVELTDQIAEDYVRGAYAADQAAEAEPEPAPALTYEQSVLAGYGANRERSEREARARADGIAIAQMQADAQEFEHGIGRTLTARERDQLEQAQAAQVFRGQAMNVQEAAATAGIRSWSEMDDHQAAEAMVERMGELAGESTTEITVPTRHSPHTGAREVDWGEMSTDDQNAYMAAKLSGWQEEEEVE
jgi:NOL1/NOP2/fmu family ribosome biogenesis protein